MNTMYLSFGGNVSVCCVNNGKCYFYVQHDYEEHLLDLLYNYIISSGVTKIKAMLQGEWAATPYAESYVSGKLRIKNAQFFGSVNQVDVNKLTHLFKSANIEDYEFVDKFVVYESIAKKENKVCCLVDRSYASLILLVVDFAGSSEEFIKEIFYISPNSLGKYMTVLKRKYNNPKFIDVEHYRLDSDVADDRFEVQHQTTISQLLSLDFADSKYQLDKEKIAFSSAFNSYAVEDSVPVEETPAEEESVEDIPVQTEKAKKKKGGCLSVILTILIILCMLSVVGVYLINKFIGGDINSLKKKLENIQIEFSEETQYNSTVSEALSVSDTCELYEDLHITELPGIELAKLDIRKGSAAMNYFVKSAEQVETLKDTISRSYQVKAFSDLGKASEGGVAYSQRYIEIVY